MNILITGASSFVGKHLCEKLKRHKIYALGHKHPLNLEVMLGLPENMDYIFNLAAYGNHFYQTDEFQTIQANYINLYNLLDVTKNIKYKAFINFSTSSVMLPYQTFYSATKMAGEYLVKAFVNKYDKPVVNVRPATLYGSGDAPTHLIPTLFRSCLKDERIKFVKQPTHDYIHVSDLVRGVLTVAKNAKKLKGESIPIGTGISTPNNHVKWLIEKITGKKASVKMMEDLRPYDTRHWRVDSTTLRSMGWKPKIGLKEGLRRYYNYEKRSS